MVNKDEFIDRLKLILEYYKLTATDFADNINVQRSSISHIISGRNKPSLDFVLKVSDSYEEVDIYWLLKGIGEFPKRKVLNQENTQSTLSLLQNNEETKKINRIVVFYNDGTFEEYKK